MTLAVNEGRGRGPQFATVTFICLLIAGLVIRFYRLDAQSLWLDELWTAAASDPALAFRRWMDKWILPDVHPPLYYLMLRPWRAVFGDDEWALRLPSVLMSIACVVVVPLVQRWTPVVRRPLALATWFAVSTGAIWYAQEARAYALFLLLTTATTCLSVAIARRIEQRQPILGAALVLAAITLTLEYVHYFGLLVAAGAFGAPFLFALATGNRRALGAVVTAGAASVLLFLPWIALHVPRLTGKLHGSFWITNNWSETFPIFAGFVAGRPAIFVAISLAVIGALALRPRLARRPEYFVPLVIMGITLIGALAVSLHTPVITARNLFILLPPFYVLAIAAFGDLEDIDGGSYKLTFRLLPAVLAALYLGFSTYQLTTETGAEWRKRGDQWRDAAAFVSSLPGCETGALPANEFPKEIYAYYLPPAYSDRLVEVNVLSDGPPAVPPSELASRPCPLLLWTGHTTGTWVVNAWLERIGLDRKDVFVQAFRGHNIVLRHNAIGRKRFTSAGAR